MSSTLERQAVAVGELLVGEGPAVVIRGRVSLRGDHGPGDAYAVLRDAVSARGRPRGRVTLVEPSSAADLPAIAELADAVVVGASWTRDIPLVRAAAALGLPVVVERRASASLEEWLELAAYCAAEGDGQVILCEGSQLDLGLMRAARAASGRPVLADVSRDVGLAAAAIAAGADGLLVDDPIQGRGAADGQGHGAADGQGRGGADARGRGAAEGRARDGASGQGRGADARGRDGAPGQGQRAGESSRRASPKTVDLVGGGAREFAGPKDLAGATGGERGPAEPADVAGGEREPTGLRDIADVTDAGGGESAEGQAGGHVRKDTGRDTAGGDAGTTTAEDTAGRDAGVTTAGDVAAGDVTGRDAAGRATAGDVEVEAAGHAALREAEEAVTIVGALVRHESPATLPECREAIDRVDAALATLLERRAALAGIVQRLKPVGGFAGRDLDRERALVAKMASRAPSLGEARLAPIMNAVIEAGLHLAEERAKE
ncbi:hypothetical protein GCM10022419_109880 [Nonomuraea rosea]|uniref:Chorismate mutase domain-containing protein n=1 Tax=Nonomuraea rosea TaxID=638574 RepID=A0ABP6ZGK7_9ACTN